MKWILLLLLTTLCLADDLYDKIQSTQALLLEKGPSVPVLAEFNQVIKLIENDDVSKYTNQLIQLMYKKSLIEINLNKEKDAIEDLKRVLQLNDNFVPAKDKLVDLYMEMSRFDDVRQVTDEVSVMEKIDTYEKEYVSMEKDFSNSKYEDCRNKIDVLMGICPMNASLYHYNIEVIKHVDYNTKAIIRQLSHLIKLEGIKNLDNYNRLSQYSMFGDVNYDLAVNNIKQCLRIDNEFVFCAQTSKMFTSFRQLLLILLQYSISLSNMYVEGENEFDEDFDYNFVKQFLFDQKPGPRALKGLPSSVKTNYDYLVYKVNEFDKLEQVQQSKIIDDLNKLGCEVFIQTGDNNNKVGKQICGKVEEGFLPKHIPEIDKLLKQKKYSEVHEKMKSFPQNVHRSKMFQSRYSPVEQYRRRQQQQHHHHQQQQQRQRFYQQQQQQQRAPPPPPSKPKNDYYKVLDVARDADQKTIKKAHRTQTLKYHPDKYKGNDLTPEQIEAKMQDINTAYEVLSDPDSRSRYDRGDDPNDQMSQGPQQNPFRRTQFGGGRQFQFNFDSSNFFGNGFNFGGFNQGSKRRGR